MMTVSTGIEIVCDAAIRDGVATVQGTVFAVMGGGEEETPRHATLRLGSGEDPPKARRILMAAEPGAKRFLALFVTQRFALRILETFLRHAHH
jgi:hypothetical protein